MLSLLSFLYRAENGSRYSFYHCATCSKVVLRRDSHARNQKTCGCVPARLIHGENRGRKRSTELSCYRSILQRCYDERNKSYADYGGRGIEVCDRWRNSFQAFLADMGRRPSCEHSIDRVNVDGNYSPENCRWATKQEQARNTRANRHITVGGETKVLAEWLRLLGVSKTSFYRALSRGESELQALGVV